MVARRWVQSEGSCRWFELLPVPKEGAPWLSDQLAQMWGRGGRYQLIHMWSRGEGGVKLEIYQVVKKMKSASLL